MIARRTYVFCALAFAAILFMGVNIFSSNFFTNARLDLTQTGQFTLNKGTRNILANLKEPVTLKLFYSRTTGARYAATASYAKRVRDLLGEYVALGHGKLICKKSIRNPSHPKRIRPAPPA